MGESLCLVQPFSYVSGMPNADANQDNPNPLHALGESVSFGRFMSESLAWEKWSSFSQKRYVEEAERYAQPGSVAQKKAFFEAHYKKIAAKKAAALLEQANATSDDNMPETKVEDPVCDANTNTNDSQTTMLNPHDSQTALLNSEVAVSEAHQIQSQDTDKDDLRTTVDVYDSGIKGDDLEIDKVVRADAVTDTVTENKTLPSRLVNNKSLSRLENVEDMNMLSGLEDSGTPQMEKPLLKLHKKSTEDVPPSARKKNPVLSSIRSSVFRKSSKVPPSPAKSMTSVHPRKENLVTPHTRNTKIEAIDQKRSTPKSLLRFMNTPVRQPIKSSIPAALKIESVRVAPSAWKPPKDRTPLKTPTKEYANGVNKHSVTTPCSESRSTCRLETPIHPAASGSKTTGPKWHILSAVSKSLTACRKKLQSPTVSTPFVLRTEERAARRKQKLEEKFNDKEAEKVQLQTKLKEKAETEFRKLRQSLCFKARPLPKFYKERETSNHQINKIPRENLTSRTLGKKAPSTVQATISQHPLLNSSKSNSSKNVWKKNAQTPTHSSTLSEMITHENTSPNIQL